MGAFLRSFRIQCRVSARLIMRETYTRFGRENLGFAWMFGEFLIFAMPVILMWHFIRGRYEHGLLVVPFIWSGYLPILLFRHIGGHMLRAVQLNMSLFYHRNVTPFDAVIARIAVEILGNYGAAVFSFFLFYSIGVMDWPRDMPLIFVGYFYMTWWCVSVGLVIAAFSERTVIFEKVWAADIVHVSAGFGLFLSSRLDAGKGTGHFADRHAGAAVLRDDPRRHLWPGDSRLLRHPPAHLDPRRHHPFRAAGTARRAPPSRQRVISRAAWAHHASTKKTWPT